MFGASFADQVLAPNCNTYAGCRRYASLQELCERQSSPVIEDLKTMLLIVVNCLKSDYSTQTSKH